MKRIGILGGGISGVALAAQLDGDVELLEKRARIGGLCSSITEQGFTFDAAGPHIMFSKNKDVLAEMVAALGENVHQRRRENRIWFKNCLLKYPFENDLASLPKEDNFECISGYLQNPRANEIPANLADWSYVTFGAGISEKYFIPYNRKIWNCDPEMIGLEFVSRIPKPPLVDVLKSSIGISTEGYLHQLFFYYPIDGGYESLVQAYAARVRAPLHTSWNLQRIERVGEGWLVENDRGEEKRFDQIVSTIPVHELLGAWHGAPQAAREAASRLRYNSLLNVLLGFDINQEHPYTAIYVPDPDIVFHRLSFPKSFSERCVPAGCTGVMAEITVAEGDEVWLMTDEEIITRVIEDLKKVDLVDTRRLTYRRVVRIRYGYPLYELEYRRNVAILRDAVEGAGVRLLGRFAQFDYINSDVCIERAIALAAELQQG